MGRFSHLRDQFLLRSLYQKIIRLNVVFPFSRFNGYKNYDDFKKLVATAPYKVGPRRIDEAMKLALDVFSNSRHNVPNIIILLTTGPQTPIPGYIPLRNAVKPLLLNGIRPYVVAIGREIEQWNMQHAVSRNGDVFPIGNSQQLLPSAGLIAKEIVRRTGTF